MIIGTDETEKTGWGKKTPSVETKHLLYAKVNELTNT